MYTYGENYIQDIYKRQCGISEDYLTAKEKLTIINKNSILATKNIIEQIV